MNFNRFLKYINYLLVAAFAAAAGIGFWYVWRVLPQTSGSIQAPVSANVTVARDALGVPHIKAATEDDLYFAQGYVTAQDRIFQMELGRRQAGGELAEVFGSPAIEGDVEMRRLRMRRLAEGYARNLAEEERRAFAAYARGVNHFIETHRGKLPMEFALAGFEPRPWTIADSLLIALSMYRAMSETYKDELLKRNLLAGGDAEKVNLLFPRHSSSDVALGSNAWAVSGKLTKSGKPLLCSDPHLQYSLPGVWYQVHLQSGDLDVAGVHLPGLPGVGIGHNRRIAWGITALQYDEQDLYRETITPAGDVYLYRGQAERAYRDREMIRVKGKSEAETMLVVTRHGPVVVGEGKDLFTVRWTAAELGQFHYGAIAVNKARNWDEFRKALSNWGGPGFNFLYADVDGNIGYQVVGNLPIRKGGGDVPQDGSKGEDEWQGFIPFEKLPSYYNPPSGMLISANQNPFPQNYEFPVNGHFAPDHRARQIRDLISKRQGWDVAGMTQVQKDLYSNLAHFIAQQTVAACKARRVSNPELSDAIELLSAWNGQMEADSPAALVATLVYQQVRLAMVNRASPGKGSLYDNVPGQGVVYQLLSARPADWFQDFDQLLVRALQDAVEAGTKLQGRNVKKWKFGEYNELLLRSPIIGRLPWVGKYFQVGPEPMGGAASTVRVSSKRAGQSMRFIADLGDLENSRVVQVGGQSEQWFSGHSRDQWNTWLAGGNFRMEYGRVESRGVLELTPR